MNRPHRPLLLYLLLLFLVACGASQRAKALNTAEHAVDAAYAGWWAWDDRHQDDIIERSKSTSYEAGKAELDAYQALQGQIIKGFIASYQAIAAARRVNDDPSASAALAEVAKLLANVKAAKGDGP